MTKLSTVSTIFLAAMMSLASCNAFSGISVSNSNNKRSTRLAATSERQPWDLLRFVRQSSRFVEILPSKPVDKVVEPGDILWKAGQKQGNDFTFAPLDDVVMGGASSSNFDGATGKWRGSVTDSNNGGFVGIRSTPFVNYDMSSCKGIRLKVTCKSGPSRLKIVVRDSTEFNGVGWTSSANIGGNSRNVDIPFAKQVPTKFAKTVEGETFDKENVKGFQLVYSKFEYDGALNPKFKVGDIDVQVEEISTY